MSRRTPGEQIGPWTVVRDIGQGGNGEVFEATAGDGGRVALKVLKAINPAGEPYGRFCDEVAIMTKVGPHPGVLPLLASSVPLEPSRKNPPWLATPIAVAIRDAMTDQPVEVVVEAIANVAETLADLQAKFEAFHRDIKPPNLFSYDGRWVVGDFGLADFPLNAGLTPQNQKLGPVFFIAPEMLRDGSAPSPTADVYSLAKTLWVLATGQTYPPQGEQRIDVPAMTLAHFIAHPRVRTLDRLVERATRHDPTARPSMSEFARELREWLNPVGAVPSPGDVSHLRARFEAAVEPARRTAASVEDLQVQAMETFKEMRVAMAPLLRTVQQVVPAASMDPRDTIILEICGYITPLSEPKFISAKHLTIIARPIPGDSFAPVLRCGFALQLRPDGKMHIGGSVLVGGQTKADQQWKGMFREMVSVGSPREPNAAMECVAAVQAELPRALEALVQALER